ncbi:ZN622/Rei1/Reh1, zinc finger C2H2-type [Dillenia turbinata]|uniref:type I protein arginine methyltransferase n=1 Tax=Dillenia turbinata TaxID=194707 RepID=A0AAN8ZDP7_9MAGN
MAMKPASNRAIDDEDENEEEETDNNWDDWSADEEEESKDSDLLCLFCDSKFTSSDLLFHHCIATHHFDFQRLRNTLNLDFYGCFKLINFIRAQVAENRCWSCGTCCQTRENLHKHLHEFDESNARLLPWDDERYLKPFLFDDSLLFSFGDEEEGEDDNVEPMIDDEDLSRFGSLSLCIDDDNNGAIGEELVNGVDRKEGFGAMSIANDAKEIRVVNEGYFGSYSSFGIHREMLSDKVRMDAYRQAILGNPSLMKGAVVLDVGCGTGILSLFAAQAGATRVIAVEASEKMAAVATKIAKDNGLLHDESPFDGDNQSKGVVKVIQTMIEDLDKSTEIEPHTVDVLLSEWMGYCLLYESMLSSVLFARDRLLKPGGAILPDTATIFAAGFGRGGTSIPFWENVDGFNMSCVGKELLEDAAKFPIVDVVDSSDLVTGAIALQTFDLATMKHGEMDFTASIELEPKLDHYTKDMQSHTIWCYGVVLWFDTGFTDRFCKETPTVLSTSPFTPRTHWSQTILTFRKPIAVTSAEPVYDGTAEVGSEACPATKLQSRISIVRAALHRSIDISLEIAGIGPDGRKHSWPVQIFSLQ